MVSRKPTWPRAICTECARSIAVGADGCLVDHNRVASGGGGLFRNRRYTGDGLCPGTGEKARREASA
jgi:hypothetical protein